MGTFGIWHWLIVLAIVLILFGKGKISGLMGDLGSGIRAFKKGMSEETSTDGEAGQVADKKAEHA
ncbi:MAG: twin-arginine translocase TatA/TatE family subunit [Rhodospirillales bacterium]|nr:twin-arginine translocase TatA/TatE family subunit [Rhodospirillales bacterium]